MGKRIRIFLKAEERETGDDALGSWRHIESVLIHIKEDELAEEAILRAVREFKQRLEEHMK